MNLTLLKLKTDEYCLVPTEHCRFNETLNLYYTYDDNFNCNLAYEFTSNQCDLDNAIGTQFNDLHIVESVFSNYNYVFLYGIYRNHHIVIVVTLNKAVTLHEIFEGLKFSIDSVVHCSYCDDINGIVTTRCCEDFDHPDHIVRFKRSNTVQLFYEYIKMIVLDNSEEECIGNICFYNFVDKEGNLYYRTQFSINKHDLQQNFPSSSVESNEVSILERNAGNLRM
ncbi:hypothetical protein [Ehrlichia canis]|uniref:Uncharacterized protein n=1 Tax=Ehrlichia canis (strain Jake) TaxID=269484 RepID=A0ACA6AVM2_EHRCJ|nr:hypothetical protein [Ehrlichia canis]AAZ68476.1 hypothetical protein Ecaj_0434 [Ehrlichia canis str. Jake]AUO54774.1 hypothetical protein C1I72_02640 [Ehrlichia canis]UKC53520.1 hypothetical protein s20019040002_000563 [Ehrlichia canis]UKC54458.1 hypothetical protein s20026770001_000564 [Ehrlichia canis]UKC55394.1 hypothetical protein s21009500007_000564 [Ehrlichia canis]